MKKLIFIASICLLLIPFSINAQGVEKEIYFSENLIVLDIQRDTIQGKGENDKSY